MAAHEAARNPSLTVTARALPLAPPDGERDEFGQPLPKEVEVLALQIARWRGLY